jgi:hypothetical protein
VLPRLGFRLNLSADYEIKLTRFFRRRPLFHAMLGRSEKNAIQPGFMIVVRKDAQMDAAEFNCRLSIVFAF